VRHPACTAILALRRLDCASRKEGSQDRAHGGLERVVRAIHEKLVWILLGTYALAAFWPGPGLLLRRLSVATIVVGRSSLDLGSPTLLLELLLFNASLGVRAGELSRLVRRTHVALVGLLANSALPLLLTSVMALILSRWPDSDEAQSLLVGLAFIAAMPIAGSSTAWSQNAEGNLALSLGLILGSTLLSPFLTPLVFRIVSLETTGDYSADLLELAGVSTELFLALAVVVPSILGLGVRRLIGGARVGSAMTVVKLVNSVVLIALNYINAAAALPRVLRRPDSDYLALVFAVAAITCVSAFACGRGVGALVRAEEPERVSLMFGLGMNNNGTGLVLASTAMGGHPNVLLSIVAYNLVQQVVAGIADHLALRRPSPFGSFRVTGRSPARPASRRSRRRPGSP
jgi:bile acid:Na+ symporter, BASS family